MDDHLLLWMALWLDLMDEDPEAGKAMVLNYLLGLPAVREALAQGSPW